MATYYNNDYGKKMDHAMWELHEIRHKIQGEKISIKKINEHARLIISNWEKNKNLSRQSS